MLYLSLFFILAGLLVFFYSAFHDAGSLSFRPGSGSGGSRHDEDDIIEKTVPEQSDDGPVIADETIVPERIYSGDNDEHEGIHHEISRHLLSDDEHDAGEDYTGDRAEDDNLQPLSPPLNAESREEETVVKEKTDPNESYSFVLFDDRSSVVDYRNGFGSIDPSLEDYKNIKRIGNGRFVLDREGINFYMEKKLFRFDFYRINEIITGKNYIAAFLKGSNAAKLFVVENETELIDLVRRKFQDYHEAHQ